MTQASNWGVPLAAESPVTPAEMATRMDDSLDALLSSHLGAARPAYAVAGTVWGNSATGQLFLYDGTTDFPIPHFVAVPATATSPGNPGDMAQEAGFLYHCVATDTWERVATAAW